MGTDSIRLALPPEGLPRNLADLAEQPWVMEPEGTASRQWAVQQCRTVGFEPEVRFDMADLTAHVRLIASGHAVGMLPDLVWTDASRPVHLVELPGSPVREIFTATRRSSAEHEGIVAVRGALHDAFEQRSMACSDDASPP